MKFNELSRRMLDFSILLLSCLFLWQKWRLEKGLKAEESSKNKWPRYAWRRNDRGTLEESIDCRVFWGSNHSDLIRWLIDNL